MQVIYLEKNLQAHPRANSIIQRFPNSQVILCNHYGEVFNIKSQNFRKQKRAPALILAEKTGRRVLPTPESFGIGGLKNYYFSHMLNCIFDCRYCFLQGLYPSANYVVFVNYEDFMTDMTGLIQEAENTKTNKEEESCYLFSGYDGDSLAYEPVTGFIQAFYDFFQEHPGAYLELRTKAANIQSLLTKPALQNIIVAFSFTPQAISTALEHKVPSVLKRLEAMRKLAEHGWPIGLRLDPLIDAENFELLYKELIEQIFKALGPYQYKLHSISLGTLRFPKAMFKKVSQLYPDEPLFAQAFDETKTVVSYGQAREAYLKECVQRYINHHNTNLKLFSCSV